MLLMVNATYNLKAKGKNRSLTQHHQSIHTNAAFSSSSTIYNRILASGCQLIATESFSIPRRLET